MFWKRFFASQPRNDSAWPLYEAIVAQARSPELYRDLGVPDTLDGRFESIVLHLVLVLRRLKRDFPEGTDLAEALQEAFFADMDRSLREMGAGDLGVGKRVKRMAEGFMGRLGAYEEALNEVPLQGGEGLQAVLRRNVFGTLAQGQGDVAGLAAYALAQAAALDAQDGADLRHGRVTFSAAPAVLKKGGKPGLRGDSDAAPQGD
ncbi:MAG: ubiquinol-cytochrome C chaperone family protein [Kiloniellaceae bacterium]